MMSASGDIEEPRLQRSLLAVPGANPDLFRKAIASDADSILLDLEDAVASGDKDQARRNVIQALNELDWRGAGKSVSVRVNGLASPCFYRDMVAVLEQAGHRLDSILLPKAGSAGDIYVVDVLIAQITAAAGHGNRIGVEALIESAAGLGNVESIAAAGSRLVALHFGAGDLAASLGMRCLDIGGTDPDYPGDLWHASRSRMVIACKCHGLRAVDGPYGNFEDTKGFLDAARRAAALGCEGKWAIHPDQVPLANPVFSPDEAQVAHARRILAAMAQAADQGCGVARLDGRMIDAASARMAANIIAIDRRIRERGQESAP